MSSISLTPQASPVEATVDIPGSKSYTNRALLIASLTPGVVEIVRPLISDDTEAMLSCLGALGIQSSRTYSGIRISNDISATKAGAIDLDARISGTTIRFILALSCVLPGTKTVHGEAPLNKRPIKDLVDALRQLGAEIEYTGQEGFPPLRVSSSKLRPGTVRMSGSISSQYLSALLMVAPLIGEVIIEVEGEQISKPYIDMTIETMRECGVSVVNDSYKRYVIPAGHQYSVREFFIEGDVSSAGYFAAIAAITKSTITLAHMNPKSLQADMGFLKILEQMGNEIVYEERAITVVGKGVKAMEVDMEHCPDQAQTLAVLAAFAPGKTVISGVRSLRVKETERVKALEQELAKMGIKTESTNDVLTIYGGSPQAATIDTYGDHRMAMSFAVAGAVLPGMRINNPEVVGKTFPDFWDKLQSIGIAIHS